jgi:hypothetical protein
MRILVLHSGTLNTQGMLLVNHCGWVRCLAAAAQSLDLSPAAFRA